MAILSGVTVESDALGVSWKKGLISMEKELWKIGPTTLRAFEMATSGRCGAGQQIYIIANPIPRFEPMLAGQAERHWSLLIGFQ